MNNALLQNFKSQNHVCNFPLSFLKSLCMRSTMQRSTMARFRCQKPGCGEFQHGKVASTQPFHCCCFINLFFPTPAESMVKFLLPRGAGCCEELDQKPTGNMSDRFLCKRITQRTCTSKPLSYSLVGVGEIKHGLSKLFTKMFKRF